MKKLFYASLFVFTIFTQTNAAFLDGADKDTYFQHLPTEALLQIAKTCSDFQQPILKGIMQDPTHVQNWLAHCSEQGLCKMINWAIEKMNEPQQWQGNERIIVELILAKVATILPQITIGQKNKLIFFSTAACLPSTQVNNCIFNLLKALRETHHFINLGQPTFLFQQKLTELRRAEIIAAEGTPYYNRILTGICWCCLGILYILVKFRYPCPRIL